MFLIVSSTQTIPTRSEKLLQCDVRDEQRTHVKSFQGLVNPKESYQTASGLWVAQTLVKDNEGICWVRILNIHDEDIVAYKNSQVGNLEETELEQQVFSLQAKESAGTFTESFTFEKHVNINCVHLTRYQLDAVKRLCQKYEKFFSKNSNDLGFNNQIEHQIKLKPNAQPFRRAYGSMSFDKRKAMKKIVEGSAEADQITPTHSDCAAPSILVPKKYGSYRLVVDYRGLNKQIEKTCWPLPRINDVIDSLEGNLFFSSIDLTSGYFQMALKEDSQNLTAFITPMGLYKWKRLPMALASAPGAFRNSMELIFSGLSYEIALVYLDDIIVFGENFEEHLERLELVFGRLKKSGLILKGSKFKFFQKKIRFLGHLISEKEVEVDQEKMKAPTNLKEVRAILGLLAFYRKFIPGFGKTSEPLYNILKNDKKSVWTNECESARKELKNKLLTVPTLGYPNNRDNLTLTQTPL